MQIRIVKFWTKYPPNRPPVDMVEYCAPGMAQKSTTVARISDLNRVRHNADGDDTAGQTALRRWQMIEPAYAAWKQGQTLPDHGTPLAAWPGISSEQAEVFRTFGFKSVEDIAEATSSVITRVQLPGVMDIQANAKRFLASFDQNRVASNLAEKDQQIATLTDQLEELRQMILAKADDDDELEADGSSPPKRRGRPPKQPVEAMAE